jgi:hypothetical protein
MFKKNHNILVTLEILPSKLNLRDLYKIPNFYSTQYAQISIQNVSFTITFV